VNEAGVLIVGGGFLGRALALKLAGEGRRVSVLSPRAEDGPWPAGIAAVNGRQEDRALASRLLDGHETVIHAAWGTTPGSSAGRPELEATAGLMPFLAFLETVQRFPERRLFFLSSGGTVYGEAGPQPADENRPLRPLSCHGAGKASAEAFLAARAARTVILRPSNIYGPGQGLRSGFGVVRHLLRCAIEDQPFQMWGDGAQMRDYLFVDDFAEAVMRLIEIPGVSGVFNLGSGAGTPLRELIGQVEGVAGRAIRVERRPPRPGDVGRILLDIRRIRQAAGWSPAASLAEGLAGTLRWLEEADK